MDVASLILSALSIIVTVSLSIYVYIKGNVVMREMQRLQISLSELEIEEKMTCIKEEIDRIQNNHAEKQFHADLLVGNCRASLRLFRLTSKDIQEEFGKLLNKSLLTLHGDGGLKSHFSELCYYVERYIGFLEAENEKDAIGIARAALAELKLLQPAPSVPHAQIQPNL